MSGKLALLKRSVAIESGDNLAFKSRPDLDPIEPLEEGLEALPQSDPDEVEEDPSEGSTPAEYSDADVWEYDPEEVPTSTSSDEDQ
ncbi:hypothetical protein RIF29_03600 [Crotalaria pallida]|uniref:Uncharacterized protein n=1 Tax=Crotalaria pallida TaxID=3830 RepID=A0AAN9P8U9_CROPI